MIRGTGVASDGRAATLMSPDVTGQVAALEQAWRESGLDPASVGLVEAHGTATPAGDGIELQTLGPGASARPTARPRAGLGSVKSMIGHAMAAAGAAGLAKAAMALHDRVLPPTLHVEDPHPDLAATRFRTIDRGRALGGAADGQLRVAGVDAFGFGGINAHLVLEEHPSSRPPEPVDPLPPSTVGDAVRRRRGPTRPDAAVDRRRPRPRPSPGSLLRGRRRRRGRGRQPAWPTGTPTPRPPSPAPDRPGWPSWTPRRSASSWPARWSSGADRSAAATTCGSSPRACSPAAAAWPGCSPGVEATFDPHVDDVADHLGRPAPAIPGAGGRRRGPEPGHPGRRPPAGRRGRARWGPRPT